MERQDFARRFPDIVAGLPAADLDALISALKLRVLVQGDELTTEHEPARGAWLLFDGTLGVTLTVGRRRVSLGRLERGMMVGEVSFIDGGPASATLTAQGPVTVLELTPSAVDGLVRLHPRSAAALNRAACEALAGHLRAATDKLMKMRGGMARQTTLDEMEGESLLDALKELLGLGRK